MQSQYHKFKNDVISLRRKGCTYGEIQKKLNQHIAKSTMSNWCKKIILTQTQQKRITQLINRNITKGRAAALVANKIKRHKYLQSVAARVHHINKIIKNRDVAKIALAMLYLGEGSKTTRGTLIFGNSDPNVIKLFLGLLRFIYNLDEKKFRCTVQCRADQNTKKLERFWTKITKIPLKQFYKSRIDPRTIGKPTKNINYKGVCKIDYFSADLFHEIMAVIQYCQTN